MKSKLHDYIILVMQEGTPSEVRYSQATDRTAISRAERMSLELGGDFDLGTGRVSVVRINREEEGSASYQMIWTQNVDQQKASAISLAKGAISHRKEPEDAKKMADFILDEATLTTSQSAKAVAARYQFEHFRENRVSLLDLTEMLLALATWSGDFEGVEGSPFPPDQRRHH